uniref:Sterol 24-C-methyltransferase-like n=1 Tax=Saccoglossus kowalevskii TaxID=10224 RepID=A0ABM0M7Z6_SACKO|nr:PREDICTED: sterol 24-C-methyltransferase-like [Saccoglossus kowalevskii]
MTSTETADMFSRIILQHLNSGFLSVGIAFGSTTGLFQAMENMGEGKTSQEIADAAGLKERYVREWLGVMVTGKIVEMDDESETFNLPGTPRKCMPYSSYTGLHELMKKNTRAKYSKLPNFITSVKEVRPLLESGVNVVDIGCGDGFVVCRMAEAFPTSEFHGVDISEEAIISARNEAATLGLTNVTFHTHTAARLPAYWSELFDYVIACDTIHDQAYPDVVLSEIRRILKPNGYFSMMDIMAESKITDNMSNPIAPMLYMTSLMSCMPLSLYFENGAGLGTMWGKDKALGMLKSAGFQCITVAPTEDELPDYHYFNKKV